MEICTVDEVVAAEDVEPAGVDADVSPPAALFDVLLEQAVAVSAVARTMGASRYARTMSLQDLVPLDSTYLPGHRFRLRRSDSI